jgi:predicted dehydrogenase
VSIPAESDGPELAARAAEVRAQLAPDEQGRFDAELAKARDLRLTGYVVLAWARMLRVRREGGTRWAALEARLRRGEEPEWDGEPLEGNEAIQRILGVQ